MGARPVAVAVHIEDGETPLQHPRHGGEAVGVGPLAVDHDQRRPVAAHGEGERGKRPGTPVRGHGAYAFWKTRSMTSSLPEAPDLTGTNPL